MLLLTGSPASGKTSFCVSRLRERLRAGGNGARLLVPTTTMAEHLRNELAREGLVFSPRAVSTFGKFVADQVPDLQCATTAALEIIVADLLETAPLGRYAAVRRYAGFRSALVRAIQETAGAGASVADLRNAGAEPDFVLLFDSVLAETAKRGWCTRPERLRIAAERLASGPELGSVFVAGFYAFTPPEVAVLRAIDERASEFVVAMPESPSGLPALRLLRTFAKEERVLPDPPAHVETLLVTASTADDEAAEIARRILEQHATGRPFSHMGVVVRSEQPYAPALRTAFERFGIPARFYFSRPLASEPVVRYLLALADCAVDGWDHERALPPLRSNGSPLAGRAGDGWEYRVRTHLPGRGLEGLRAHANSRHAGFFDDLARLDEWRNAASKPEVWAERFDQLPALLRTARPAGGATHDTAIRWRSEAMAVTGLRSAVAEAARSLDVEIAVDCRTFIDALKTVVNDAGVRLVDHRKDVVHVIDAVEARQWRLPVVFACGLVETQFPKYHLEDAILGDEVRRALQQAGIPVRTAAAKQEDERYLFDVVLSRAREQLVLSYPKLNDKGDPWIPSFSLEHAVIDARCDAVPARPRAGRERAAETAPGIRSEDLLAHLASECSTLSASKIDAYQGCPFGFFARDVLKLQEPPPWPDARFTPMQQGNVGHRALELHYGSGVAIQAAFDQAFAETCADEHIPDSYRTEAARMEVLYGVELLVRENPLPRWSEHAKVEEKFDCETPDRVRLKGKIDRIEIDARGNAVVIDYKYQTANMVNRTVSKTEAGEAAQAGAYLIAARTMGHNPVGMLFCGFKQNVHVKGWVLEPFTPAGENATAQAQLDEIVTNTRRLALDTLEAIKAGRFEFAENDDKCRRCTYLKICRADVAPAAMVATQ